MHIMFLAIGATDRATHLNIAQLFRHPGIGSRFTQRNRAQDFPCAKLKRRSHRRERDIELEILSGKIIGQLRSNRIEMSMLTRHNVCLQSSAQDRQLAFHRAPIHKLKQAQTFIVRDCEHRSERRLDSFGKQAALFLRHRRWFTENPRESVAKTAGRFEAAAVLRFIYRTTTPDLAERKSHPPRAVISLKRHSVMPFELPPRR